MMTMMMLITIFQSRPIYYWKLSGGNGVLLVSYINLPKGALTQNDIAPSNLIWKL